MSDSPEYFLGKVAAHAYADEMRELMAGWEKLGQDPFASIKQMAAQAPSNVLQAGKAVGKAVPAVAKQTGQWVAPVAQGAKLVDPLAGL